MPIRVDNGLCGDGRVTEGAPPEGAAGGGRYLASLATVRRLSRGPPDGRRAPRGRGPRWPARPLAPVGGALHRPRGSVGAGGGAPRAPQRPLLAGARPLRVWPAVPAQPALSGGGNQLDRHLRLGNSGQESAEYPAENSAANPGKTPGPIPGTRPHKSGGINPALPGTVPRADRLP